MSDRILVMRQGRVVGEHCRGQLDQEQIMKEAFGAGNTVKGETL